MRFVTGMQRMPAHSMHHPRRQPAARDSPAEGGRKLLVTWGPVEDSVVLLDRNETKEHREHNFPLISCSSSWHASYGLFELWGFFSPGELRVAFSHLEDLEGFFKVYWNSNGISPILVLTYPPWSLGVVLVLSRLTFILEWGFSLWEIGVLVNAG